MHEPFFLLKTGAEFQSAPGPGSQQISRFLGENFGGQFFGGFAKKIKDSHPLHRWQAPFFWGSVVAGGFLELKSTIQLLGLSSGEWRERLGAFGGDP